MLALPRYCLKAIVILAFSSSAAGVFAQSAALALGRTGAVPKEFFGMHIHRASESNWPDVRFSGWRLWDAYTAWPNVQPKRGEWDFRNIDRAVELADSKGVALSLPLGLSPSWAAARPEEKSYYELGNASEPTNEDDWRQYVRRTASRYKGRIRIYEVWNEPDLKGFFTGSAQQMARMTIAACQELKAIDSNIIFVAPSPTSGPQAFDWYRQFLTSVGQDRCIDVVGWHLYTTEGPPEGLVSIVAKIRSLLSEFGWQKKPIWNTESGYFIENDSGPKVTGTIANKAKLVLDKNRSEAFVARSLILAWAAGVDRFYWYAWDNGKMGLANPDTKRRKISAAAYDGVYGWLVNSELSGCWKATRIWTCRLQRGGRDALIVWAETDEIVATKRPWSQTLVQDLLSTTRLSDVEIPLSQVPLLLVQGVDPW